MVFAGIVAALPSAAPCRLLLVLLILALTACEVVNPQVPTAVPTRALSAPTLEASPTFPVRPPTRIPDSYTGAGQNNPQAAALPPDSELPPAVVPAPGEQVFGDGVRVQVTAEDGTLLAGWLYESRLPAANVTPSPEGIFELARVPGILMLGGQPTIWGDFPARLRDAGFTVLVMEMRAEGSVADTGIMLRALINVGTVNPALVGVIGAGQGADAALIGCAVNLLCDTAVLLSPIAQTTLLNVLIDYNPRPLLLAASSEDAPAFQTAQALELAAGGDVVFQQYTGAGRGAEMLIRQPDLAGVIILWMQRFLVEPP